MAWAKKRARQLASFYSHLLCFVIVGAGLVTIDLVAGGEAWFLGLDWAFWPIGGWGIGVAMHGLSLIRESSSGRWEGRKAHQLYEKRLRSTDSRG